MKSQGFVGVHIVEWELDFTNFGCYLSFYFYFYLLSTATDCTLIVYEGRQRSAYLFAFAFANAFYRSDCKISQLSTMYYRVSMIEGKPYSISSTSLYKTLVAIQNKLFLIQFTAFAFCYLNTVRVSPLLTSRFLSTSWRQKQSGLGQLLPLMK